MKIDMKAAARQTRIEIWLLPLMIRFVYLDRSQNWKKHDFSWNF